VARFCEHSNEPPDSVKCGEFFDQLSVLLLASEEGLSYMKSGVHCKHSPRNRS
jgi:hypothetical protein